MRVGFSGAATLMRLPPPQRLLKEVSLSLSIWPTLCVPRYWKLTPRMPGCEMQTVKAIPPLEVSLEGFWLKGTKIYVPNGLEVRDLVFQELHDSQVFGPFWCN